MGIPMRLMTAAATIMLVQACDLGGGDNPGQIDVPAGGTDFPLTTLQALGSDFVRSFAVTGSDTAGNDFTGNFTVQNLAAGAFNGQPAVPRARTLALTDLGTGAFTTSQTTLFLAAGFQVLGASDNLTGVLCLPDVPLAAMPPAAGIGDGGELGTLTCTDGSRQRLAWRLDGAVGGRAVAVFVTVIADAADTPQLTREDGFVIDGSGQILGAALTSVDLLSGVTVTLESPVI